MIHYPNGKITFVSDPDIRHLLAQRSVGRNVDAVDWRLVRGVMENMCIGNPQLMRDLVSLVEWRLEQESV